MLSRNRSVILGALLTTCLGVLAASAGEVRTLKTLESLVVVDATGRKLGNVISMLSSDAPEFANPLVGFQHNHLVAIVGVRPIGGFFSSLTLFFEEPGCEGNPWLLSPYPNGLMPLGAVGSPGLTVYTPDPTSSPQTITIQSRESTPGDCTNQTFEQGGLVPAIPLVNLEGQFTPPFRVEPAKGKN
jgi:hypothetical protein